MNKNKIGWMLLGCLLSSGVYASWLSPAKEPQACAQNQLQIEVKISRAGNIIFNGETTLSLTNDATLSQMSKKTYIKKSERKDNKIVITAGEAESGTTVVLSKLKYDEPFRSQPVYSFDFDLTFLDLKSIKSMPLSDSKDHYVGLPEIMKYQLHQSAFITPGKSLSWGFGLPERSSPLLADEKTQYQYIVTIHISCPILLEDPSNKKEDSKTIDISPVKDIMTKKKEGE